MTSNNIRLAKLNNGQIIEYDMMLNKEDQFEPNREVFEFLGHGEVYKINKIIQTTNPVQGRFYRQIIKNV